MVYAIKSSVGLVGFLKDTMTDTEIKDIIEHITLPEFSKYYHNFIKLPNVNIKTLARVGGFGANTMAFKLPRNVMEVIEDAGIKILGFKNNVNQALGSALTQNNPLRYNTHRPFSQNISMLYYHQGKKYWSQPVVPQFKEPDVLYYDTQEEWTDITYMDIIIKTEHPKNLTTINESARPLFQKLAMLDVMIHLHQNKLKYLNIDNGLSRVELELDRFLNAYEEKKELLDELKSLRNATNFAVLTY